LVCAAFSCISKVKQAAVEKIVTKGQGNNLFLV
jgi:hypothetical protein